MGSELSAGADRPDRGDRPREGDAFGYGDRDVTPVPAYAGLWAEGISRDEAYGEKTPEAQPDRNADEQGWAAMERLKAELKAELRDDLKATLKEELKAELESEHKAETDSIRAEYETRLNRYEARISDLEGKEARDVPHAGRDEADANPSADAADIKRIFNGESGKENKRLPDIPGRRALTAENIGAVSAGVGVYQSVAETFGHVPPELSIGASVLGFVGASMATSFVKNIYKKRKG